VGAHVGMIRGGDHAVSLNTSFGRGVATDIRKDGFVDVAFAWGRATLPLACCSTDGVRGSLEKKGAKGKWVSALGRITKRFCVLEDGVLFYYATEADFERFQAGGRERFKVQCPHIIRIGRAIRSRMEVRSAPVLTATLPNPTLGRPQCTGPSPPRRPAGGDRAPAERRRDCTASRV
jgi:hypothetical protein